MSDFTLLGSVTLDDAPLYLYEYNDYPGRFLLFSRIRSVPDEKSMIEALADRSIDLRQELIVLGKIPQLKALPAIPGKVELVKYEPNNVVLNCKTAQDSISLRKRRVLPGMEGICGRAKDRNIESRPGIPGGEGATW